MILVFDLDGTLIDSAPDIHAAVNRMLAEQGATPLTFAQVRSFIGNGVGVLIERVLEAQGAAPGDPRHADWLAGFLRHYEAASTDLTRPYPGVVAALQALKADGHRMGVCTNKPGAPTVAILQALDLAQYFEVVLGGDALPQRKPAPEPLVHVIDALRNGAPAEVVYVGDSEVDAETAQAAGVPFAFFTEGYAKPSVDNFPRRFSFASFADLPDLLRGRHPADGPV